MDAWLIGSIVGMVGIALWIGIWIIGPFWRDEELMRERARERERERQRERQRERERERELMRERERERMRERKREWARKEQERHALGHPLSAGSYNDYINGSIPGWKEKRGQRLHMDGRLCVMCGSKATQVHHVTYERLGIEDMGDLRSVCTSCHEHIHESPEHPLNPRQAYAGHRR